MRTTRFLVAALAGALVLSTMSFIPAAAAAAKGIGHATTMTFSARHYRHYRHYRYYNRGNPAVLGAVAGLFGTIAVLAARNSYYDDYYGGPYYDYGAPYPYYGYAVPYRYRGFGVRRFHGVHAGHWHGHHR